LITQPVSARNRVVGMLVERVAGLDDTRSASLGGNRMAPHRVNLRNHRYIEFWIEFGDSYRGSEARTATSDQENVVVRYVHNKHRNLWAVESRRQPPWNTRDFIRRCSRLSRVRLAGSV